MVLGDVIANVNITRFSPPLHNNGEGILGVGIGIKMRHSHYFPPSNSRMGASKHPKGLLKQKDAVDYD
jgi:hypothetical protein